MFCYNCGKQLSDTDKFCTNCGTPVNAAPAAPVFTPPVQAFTPPVPPLPQQAPPKKKKGWIAVVAALLAVAIIAGIVLTTLPSPDEKAYAQAVAFYESGQYAAALAIFEDIDVKDSAAYAARCRRQLQALTVPTLPPTQPTAEPTVAPTQPPISLEVNEAQLVYELTDSDVEQFYTKLEEGEALAMSSTDSAQVDAFFEALDDQYDYLESQYCIAMVLYYCDLTDTAASDLYLKATDIATDANDAYIQAARRLYLSDCAHKEVLFDDWTEQELEMLVKYTDEIPALEKRNAEIEVAYQDMQESPTMYDDMVPLYIEMVQNKNRIAQIYGYDNYYTYAYEVSYERDYGKEEIALMRTHARSYLPTALAGAMEHFIDGMETLGFADQATLSGIFTGDYGSYEDLLTDYLATLPENSRNEMLSMFDGNILLKRNTDGAMEGAFTTNITDERSVCFFGPGYSNIMTVLHEVGHYYGSKHNVLDDIPLDLAETQSQGNEWLFIAWLLEQERSELNQLIRDYKLYNDLATILICVIVDEFEQQVYAHPNVASLTGEQLDAIMASVCDNYGGLEFLSSVATDPQTYWRMVVVEQPVYYISYAVSAISAMSIFTQAQDGYESGVQAYVDVIEDVDTEAGFLANITEIGLDGPFDEEVYRAISQMVNP